MVWEEAGALYIRPNKNQRNCVVNDGTPVRNVPRIAGEDQDGNHNEGTQKGVDQDVGGGGKPKVHLILQEDFLTRLYTEAWRGWVAAARWPQDFFSG